MFIVQAHVREYIERFSAGGVAELSQFGSLGLRVMCKLYRAKLDI